MPVRIRWKSKNYFGIALMFLGACGLFQSLFIIIAQFILRIGNYFAITIIPLAVSLGLTYGAMIIFESIAQVQKRKQLKTQFKKGKSDIPLTKRILDFPITIPLLITLIIFSVFFIISYAITITFLDRRLSFIISEPVGVMILLLIANGFEKYYGKVIRY